MHSLLFFIRKITFAIAIQNCFVSYNMKIWFRLMNAFLTVFWSFWIQFIFLLSRLSVLWKLWVCGCNRFSRFFVLFVLFFILKLIFETNNLLNLELFFPLYAWRTLPFFFKGLLHESIAEVSLSFFSFLLLFMKLINVLFNIFEWLFLFPCGLL